MGNGFPKRSVVHRGCTLALIVNAIATVEASFFAVFHQWHDDTFLYDGVDGNHAAIAFEGESLLGTVFDHDSDRSPFRREGAYDLGRLFRGLPATHKRMLDKCLDC